MSSYTSFLKGRLVKGFKEVIILKIISEGDVWGYNIVSKIKERYGVKISPSIIYPILSELESKGLIKSRTEFVGRRRRKVYSITEEGLRLVEAYRNVLKAEIGGS